MTLPATIPAQPAAEPGTAVVPSSGRAVSTSAAGLAATGLMAAGALAVGALTLGSLALGRLAIGQLALRSDRARRVRSDDLTVVRLRVLEIVRTLPPP